MENLQQYIGNRWAIVQKFVGADSSESSDHFVVSFTWPVTSDPDTEIS